MNPNDKGTNENKSLEEKVDLLLEMVKEILQRLSAVSTAEGPKDPPPTPPNP